MRLKTTSAFTLIEIMVVITIVGIISLATFLPYAHHQKKILIKQAAREIAQSISEARNFAINGLNTWSWNTHVGLLFWSGTTSISYYTSSWELNSSNILWAEVHKTKILPEWVQIDLVESLGDARVINFEPITWNISIDPTLSDDALSLQISYKWATTSVLQKEIEYYVDSYISDY